LNAFLESTSIELLVHSLLLKAIIACFLTGFELIKLAILKLLGRYINHLAMLPLSRFEEGNINVFK
jgi:hypothetical protein